MGTHARRRPTRWGSAALAVTTAVGLAATGAAQPSEAAGSPRPAAMSDRAGVGWVTGMVVDRDGAPLAGVLVNALAPREVAEGGVLHTPSQRAVRTGADGRFRVRQAAQGYLVQVCQAFSRTEDSCREGAMGVRFLHTYVGPAGTTDSWVPQTSLFAASPDARRLGRVTVMPQTAVGGRLDGGAGAFVEVMRLNDTAAFHTVADEAGRWRVRGLAPGRYYVRAGADSGDGLLTWRSEPLDLLADHTAQVDGVADHGAAIDGTMTDPSGAPLAGEDVLVLDGEEPIAATGTDEQGRFEVAGLEPGDYRVGVPWPGGRWAPTTVDVTLSGAHDRADVVIPRTRGGAVTLPLRSADGGHVGADVRDELRDADGHAVDGNRWDGRRLVYTGLAPGRYTVAAGDAAGWTTRTVRVAAGQSRTLAPARLDSAPLVLRGRTAPGAVVSATTGNRCSTEPRRSGSFLDLARADDRGRYRLTGLLPGRWTVTADAWPADRAPLCRASYDVSGDQRLDLPLADGAGVSGRLVYAATGTPVIAPLSYQLAFDGAGADHPTPPHPARDKTRGASGRFVITGLAGGGAEGSLAQVATDEGDLNDLRFTVLHPFQDGTPYWLDAQPRSITLVPGERLGLGDVPLVLHGAP